MSTMPFGEKSPPTFTCGPSTTRASSTVIRSRASATVTGTLDGLDVLVDPDESRARLVDLGHAVATRHTGRRDAEDDDRGRVGDLVEPASCGVCELPRLARSLRGRLPRRVESCDLRFETFDGVVEFRGWRAAPDRDRPGREP